MAYFQLSNFTFIDFNLLNFFDCLLVRNGISFEGFCDSYNMMYKANGIRGLCRKRFSETWFSWKINYFTQINENHCYLSYDNKNTENHLENIITGFLHYFIKKWHALHAEHCREISCNQTGKYIL